MLSRTTTSVVTFLNPFVVAGYTDELPPDEYELLADEDIVQIRSFASCRRTATFLLINWQAGKSELRATDHRDLELVLAQERAAANKHEIKNSAAALSPSEDQK